MMPPETHMKESKDRAEKQCNGKSRLPHVARQLDCLSIHTGGESLINRTIACEIDEVTPGVACYILFAIL